MTGRIVRDVPFARPGGRREPLLLDLYLPEGRGPHPAVLWICGGGWRGMSKRGAERVAAWLADFGLAVVPFEYRLTDEAIHPAQIRDAKAAVRWVRAHASEFGLDPSRLGVWGDSAGGHLAELVGSSGGLETFGPPDDLADVSDTVRAVCAFYPPADFTTWPVRHEEAVRDLLGGWPDEVPDVARSASPITYVSPATPPHLVVHGDRDEIVPIEQSYTYCDALVEAGVMVDLIVLPGVGHSGEDLYGSEKVQARVLRFFKKRLARGPARQALAGRS